MTIKNKIKNITLTGLTALIGCAPYTSTFDTLGVKDWSQIETIMTSNDENYLTWRGNKSELESLAGYKVGTVDLVKQKGTKNQPNHFQSVGDCFNEYLYPNAISEVLQDIDVNKDKLITNEEIDNYEKKLNIFPVHSNKYSSNGECKFIK